jgi:hypothetical protein
MRHLTVQQPTAIVVIHGARWAALDEAEPVDATAWAGASHRGSR